jgi:hypothetical protein
MKKAVSFFVIIAVSVVMFTGCASTSSIKWSTNDKCLKKGNSRESVISKFGEPYRKSTDSNDNEVLEYRKPAKGKEGTNTFYAIGSFGILSGNDSAYVDILNVYLNNGKVIKTTYQANVLGISPPGVGK